MILKHNVQIDVRIGWNKLLVGFIGRSHYIAWHDVDYSLQLFTPIEGYNKGSAIAKLIYNEKLDLETYVNLGEKKVSIISRMFQFFFFNICKLFCISLYNIYLYYPIPISSNILGTL